MYLHYRLGGFHWLLLLDEHTVVISVNRAVDNVQKFFELMNVIIWWWDPETVIFWFWISVIKQPVNHLTKVCLRNP